MCQDSIDDTRNGTRDHGTGIVHPITHSIAAAHLDGYGILFHQFIQFQAERDHIAVDIRSGNILQMTSGADPCLQAFPDHA